ncbi:YdeI/OmpD-associated family protein [Chryseolinea sp. H1M3-3]|uniref:YdeI/OmpD-associated family protein n=1 Tax=Chryseolinea sp. H1M3-3 TaxID=3034144 RepID=UPI0023EC6B5D|nr:YdeI/OmpD-associated family protein [Chryseolinea sp. H1M3-3]
MKVQSTKKQTLKRILNPMPRGIRALLVKNGLLEKYKARPPYQQNDYLGWISRAKLEATKQKRIKQMLDELKQGDRYMKMRWGGRK